jgi:uncharacterized protein (DUF924 family)
MLVDPREILDFWFRETPPELWFSSDPEFDALIRRKFEESWRRAAEGGVSQGHRMEEALALIILFDQFPRNMFRGTAQAYATDREVYDVARAALKRGFDLEAPIGIRQFFYLPLMHSESLADQELCLGLTRERLGDSHSSCEYALRHRDVIARFGRFPARNAALGRASTPEEEDYLRRNPLGF